MNVTGRAGPSWIQEPKSQSGSPKCAAEMPLLELSSTASQASHQQESVSESKEQSLETGTPHGMKASSEETQKLHHKFTPVWVLNSKTYTKLSCWIACGYLNLL